MRILTGILLRRDLVVALEAYSNTFDSVLGTMGNVMLDELGRPSSLHVNLGSCFESACEAVMEYIQTEQTTGNVSMEVPAHNVVRKLLVRCFSQILCTSDLPAELPTLLLWALGASSSATLRIDDDCTESSLPVSFGSDAPHNNPVIAKQALLRCLSSYLRSSAEEAFVDWLRGSSVLWTSQGYPRLPTPHSRRPDTCYEQYMQECRDRSCKFLGEVADHDDEARDGPSPESIKEVFALQCRWSRIDAIISRSNIVQQLSLNAIDAVDALVSETCGDVSRPLSAALSGLLCTGRDALSLLCSTVRQGGEEVVLLVHKHFLRGGRHAFSLLLDKQDLGEQVCALAAELRGLWWKVLSELSIRHRPAVEFMFCAEQDWISAAIVRRILARSSDAALEQLYAASLLKCALVYGKGLGCVTELLLAVRLGGGSAQCQMGKQYIQLLLLLEQAAVTCSSELMFHTSTVVPGTVVEEAMQASSAIISFVKQELSEFERIVLAEGGPSQLRTAVLFLLVTVFSTDGSHRTLSEGVDYAMYCADRLAEDALNGPPSRRHGLAGAVLVFSAKTVQYQQTKAGGNVSAPMMHVSGQCLDLLQSCHDRRLFSLDGIRLRIQTLLVTDQNIPGTPIYEVGVAEEALCWQRLVCVVCDMIWQSGRNSASTDCFANSCVGAIELLNICAIVLKSPCLLLAGSASATPWSEHSILAGYVSAGILRWHIHRIQSACFLLQVQFAAMHLLHERGTTVATMLTNMLSRHLDHQYAHFFSGAIAALFCSYLRFVVAMHMAPTAEGVLVSLSVPVRYEQVLSSNHAVMRAIAKGALGDIAVEGLEISVGPSVTQLGAMLDANTNSCDWLALPPGAVEADGSTGMAIIPHLKRSWAFDALLEGAVRGCELTAWLQVLMHWQRSDHNADSAIDVAKKVHTLLKLSFGDKSAKWREESGDNEWDELHCDPVSVEAYRMILNLLISHKCFAQSGQTFAAAFCDVVGHEFSTGAGIMSALRNKSRSRSAQNRYAGHRLGVEGVLDLCEKSLDAGLNQMVDEGIHAAALLALSSPIMPWPARQRVWAQLSALRLVHLLEDPFCIQGMLPTLLCRPSVQSRVNISTESLSLYLDMTSALCTLREQEDSRFCIVAVTVFQLAQFIFASALDEMDTEENKTVVEGASATLLAHIMQLQHNDDRAATNGKWLLDAVLGVAAELPSLYSVIQQFEQEDGWAKKTLNMLQHAQNLGIQHGKTNSLCTWLQYVRVQTTAANGEIPLQSFCVI